MNGMMWFLLLTRSDSNVTFSLLIRTSFVILSSILVIFFFSLSYYILIFYHVFVAFSLHNASNKYEAHNFGRIIGSTSLFVPQVTLGFKIKQLIKVCSSCKSFFFQENKNMESQAFLLMVQYKRNPVGSWDVNDSKGEIKVQWSKKL